MDTLTGIEYCYTTTGYSVNIVPILNEARLPRINPNFDPDNKGKKEDL